MDNTNSINTTGEINNSNIFSNTKNMIIGILCILLIISVLGSQYIIFIYNILINIVFKVLSFFGYNVGTLINSSADIVGDTAKLGIDIAEGTAHNIGDIIKNQSSAISNETKLDYVINSNNTSLPSLPPASNEKTPQIHKDEPIPDNTENPIQKPITANKNNWCLVGEYQQKRGCIEIKDNDKCLSEKLFASKQMCMQTPGIYQTQTKN